MSYRVFAIRERPQDFSAVIGQDPVVSALTNALNKNKMHHAYLFTGTRGVGKTTISRILAKCLSCVTEVTASPCNTCANCLSIAQGKFLDLIEIDAASKTKVEDTRALLDTVIYAPAQGRYKIYLIDEVHMLSMHSFNALLKTLEEPPGHVKFLLATTEPQKIPATILSRCLQFTLKLVPSAVLAQHLAVILEKDNIKYEQIALQLLAQAAEGSVRDALSLLEQAVAISGDYVNCKDIRAMLGRIAGTDLVELLNNIITKNNLAVISHIHDLAMSGVDFGQLLTQLIYMLHQIAIFQQAPSIAAELDVELQQDIVNLAKSIKPEDLQIYYQIALLAKRDLPYSPQPKLAVEMAVIRMLSFVPAIYKAQSGLAERSASSSASVGTERATSAANLVSSLDSVGARSGQPLKQDDGDNKITKDNWPHFIESLDVKAIALQIIKNCEFIKLTNEQLILNLDVRFSSLLNTQRQQELEIKIQNKLNKKLKLVINKSNVDQEVIVTPAVIEHSDLKQKHANLVEKLRTDPNIQNIVNVFDGELKLDSVELIK